MRAIELQPLVAIAVSVQPIVDLGGGRRFVAFSGGTFIGHGRLTGLNGRVDAGGVDWQQVRPDGTLEIDAHYVLVAGDGSAMIEVRSTGLRAAPPAVSERMARGEAVEPDEYYFRTHIRLTTAAPQLAWLNDLIAVSTGRRDHDVVHIHVHEVS